MQASIVASAQRAPCVSASLKPAAGASKLRQHAFFGSKLAAVPKPVLRRANSLLKVQARGGGGAARQIQVCCARLGLEKSMHCFWRRYERGRLGTWAAGRGRPLGGWGGHREARSARCAAIQPTPAALHPSSLCQGPCCLVLSCCLQVDVDKPLGLVLEQSKSPLGGLRVKSASGNAAKAVRWRWEWCSFILCALCCYCGIDACAGQDRASEKAAKRARRPPPTPSRPPAPSRPQGIQAGDTVIYTSSFFGDELWPSDQLVWI